MSAINSLHLPPTAPSSMAQSNMLQSNTVQSHSAQSLAAGAGSASGARADGGSFKNFLLNSIDQVNSMQQDANRAVEHLATGGDVSPAEVFTAVQKADLAFRMMMQVRNKLVSAYQEVQNIRV
ncbi:MAG TPA: flagellar hook-basal body complex protein FliE [Pirellulales bacterium]